MQNRLFALLSVIALPHWGCDELKKSDPQVVVSSSPASVISSRGRSVEWERIKPVAKDGEELEAGALLQVEMTDNAFVYEGEDDYAGLELRGDVSEPILIQLYQDIKNSYLKSIFYLSIESVAGAVDIDVKLPDGTIGAQEKITFIDADGNESDLVITGQVVMIRQWGLIRIEIETESDVVNSDNEGSDEIVTVDSSDNESSEDDPPMAPAADPVSLSLATPDLSQADYYGVQIDPSFRTIGITASHPVECSNDGGTTWGACTSPTAFEFSAMDYAMHRVLKVRSTNDLGESVVQSFDPSTAFPNKYFANCTYTVSASENFDAFEARVSAAQSGEAICIDADVTIASNGAEGGDAIQIGVTGLTIIGTVNNPPKFQNTKTGGNYIEESVVIADGLSNLTLANLDIEFAGDLGKGILLGQLIGIDWNDDATLSFDMINHVSVVASGDAIPVMINDGRVAVIRKSHLENINPTSTANALQVTGSSLRLGLSELVATWGYALKMNDADSPTYPNYIDSNSLLADFAFGGGAALDVAGLSGGGGSYTFSHNTFTGPGVGAILTGDSRSFYFVSNTFRMNGSFGDRSAILFGSDQTLDGALNAFCQIPGATSTYSSIVNVGGNTNLGSFGDQDAIVGVCE